MLLLLFVHWNTLPAEQWRLALLRSAGARR